MRSTLPRARLLGFVRSSVRRHCSAAIECQTFFSCVWVLRPECRLLQSEPALFTHHTGPGCIQTKGRAMPTGAIVICSRCPHAFPCSRHQERHFRLSSMKITKPQEKTRSTKSSMRRRDTGKTVVITDRVLLALQGTSRSNAEVLDLVNLANQVRIRRGRLETCPALPQ